MNQGQVNPAVSNTDRSSAANRMAFIIRRVMPFVIILLALLLAVGAAAFAWLRWLLLIVAGLLALLLTAGAVYHAIATRRERRELPPRGILVDAGGFYLHLISMGKAAGGPVVVLEGGMASFAANWHWVQTGLASTGQVVAYDRAGFGWSEPGPNPRDVRHIAEELHTALHNAGIPGPYVLAGWSFGGLVVRLFTDLYPDEVAGLVLVDASHPDQWLHMPVPNADRLLASSFRIQAELCRFGFGRLATAPAKTLSAGLPDLQAREIFAGCAQRSCYRTEGEQAALWTGVSREQVHRAKPLDDLPLYLLGVSEQPLYGDIWTRLQEDLGTLSANSTRFIVQGATHESLVGRPEYAQRVVDAILQVVEAARRHTPLAAG